MQNILGLVILEKSVFRPSELNWIELNLFHRRFLIFWARKRCQSWYKGSCIDNTLHVKTSVLSSVTCISTISFDSSILQWKLLWCLIFFYFIYFKILFGDLSLNHSHRITSYEESVTKYQFEFECEMLSLLSKHHKKGSFLQLRLNS